MSLIPRSRLIIDSVRSPSVADPEMRTPRTMPVHHGRPSMSQTTRMPMTMLAATDPAKPSQVFFGLIRGAIGCLPRLSPVA